MRRLDPLGPALKYILVLSHAAALTLFGANYMFRLGLPGWHIAGVLGLEIGLIVIITVTLALESSCEERTRKSKGDTDGS